MVSVVCTLDHHANEVSGCAFSASLLASCSGDKTLRVYSAVDFSERPYSPLCGHEYGVHCCCFTSCGSYLLSCSTDGAIAVWSTDTGARVSALEHPSRSPLRACAVAPDSSLVLGGACDGTAALWDFSSGTLRRFLAVSEASVAACCFSPCAQMFVTGSTHGTLRLWGVDGSILCVQKDAHDLGVTCCSFAPQFTVGTYGCCVELQLASCGQDSRLKIWIVSQYEGTGTLTPLLHTLTGQSAPVLSCAFSSDGALVVSGSVDKTVAIYDTVSYLCMFWFRYVTAVAMSPTKPWLATGSMDRTVKVWRIGDGEDTTDRKLPSRSTLTLLSDWSEEDVQTWLREEGLEELVGIFKSNNIDGSELSRLNRESTFVIPESVGLRGRLLRKVESLKAAQSGSDGPDEFLGPITRELMRDPVIAADGYSYEREAIESWIRGKTKTSPMTNLPLQTTLLIPNRSLKMAIARWKSSQ
uniref:WD repeat, SAM and U-box domain-containing protein 1 n=1 Tax=Periophthalmus magnuspinnatus TaxID=409849 RepID=A0A3B3ZSJ6_9GOBI